MSKMANALYHIRLLDELAQKDTFIYRLHPLTKLMTTAIFILVMASFGKHEVAGLIPFVFYPVLNFTIGEIPVRPMLKRFLPVLPFFLGLGMFSPWLDIQLVHLRELLISRGWMNFFQF